MKKLRNVSVVIALLLAVLFLVSCSSVDYKNANAAMENGDYDIAIELFEKLAEKGYLDSAEKLLEAKYEKADDLSDSGDYDEAIELFEELADEDYLDSASRLNECYLQEAVAQYENGDVAGAVNALNALISEDSEISYDAQVELENIRQDYYGEDIDYGDFDAVLDTVQSMDDSVLEVFEDDIVERLAEATPSKDAILISPDELEKATPDADETDILESVEQLKAIDSILTVIDSSSETATTLQTYVSKTLEAYAYLSEYTEIGILSKNFPAIDEELGALAEAKDVSEEMMSVYQGLNEINFETLEYDKSNQNASSLVAAWKDLKDACYSFIEGFNSRSEESVMAAVKEIRESLNSLKTVSEAITSIKTSYTSAYNAIPDISFD